MRILRLHVDGFGLFNDRNIGPFEAPVTILLGANETGKSTLLEFIRATLFGFSAKLAKTYPPLTGGRHGGRITLLDEDGKEHIVERHAGARGGTVSVTAANEPKGDERTLENLLGHVPKGLFEEVFTFGLGQLSEGSSLQEDEIRTRLYSAGLGIGNLPKAEKLLREQQASIYRPSGNLGSTQRVSNILKALEAVDTKLRAHEDDAPKYARLTAAIRQMGEEEQELKDKRADTQRQLTHLQLLEQGRDGLMRHSVLEERLKSMPDYPAFPPDGLARLGEKELALRQSQDSQKEAQKDAEARRVAPEIPKADRLILDDTTVIKRAVESRGSFASSIHDLPEREGELRTKEEEVDSSVGMLGTGWTPASVLAFDASMPVHDQVEQWKKVIEDHEKSVGAEKQALSFAEQEAEKAGESKDVTSRTLEAAPQPTMAEADIEQRRRILGRVRPALDEVVREAQARSDLEAQLDDQTSAKGARQVRRMSWLLGPLALGAVAAAVIGLTNQVDPIYAVTAAILFAIGAVGAHLGIRRPIIAVGDKAGPSSGLALARRREADALERLTAAGADLGLTTVNATSLDQVEIGLNSMTGIHADVLRLQDELYKREEAHNERLQQQKRVERSLLRATALLKTDRANWTNWLETKGLPLSSSPEGILKLLNQIEITQKEQAVLDALRRRVYAIKHDIDEVRELVEPLAKRHSVNFRPDQLPSFLTAIDELGKALTDASYGAIRHGLADRASKEADEDLVRKTDLLDQRHSEFRSFMKPGGTEDPEEFRRRAKVVQDKNQYKSELLSTKETIIALFGPGASITNLLQQVSDPANLSAEIEYSREQHDVITKQIAETNQQLGKVRNELDGLSNEIEASEQRAQKEMHLEDLRDAAESWSSITMAIALLKKGRTLYERDRKPSVYLDAERFFRGITDGAYDGLHAPLDVETVEVRRSSGPLLAPNQLSRGTREQLYLSLRFGVIRDFNRQGVRVPVVVDDAFVNFDPLRARTVAQAFNEMAKTNQVLIFTCHPHLAKLFASECPETEVLDLPRRDLREVDGQR